MYIYIINQNPKPMATTTARNGDQPDRAKEADNNLVFS
jgi:hypothetical protein